MKKILLVILCCVVSAGAFSQHLSLQERLNTDKNAKVLNFRPAEKMALSGDYNYRLDSYNTDDYYLNCNYYNASHRLVWKLCVKSSLTSMNDRFHFTTTKKAN
jgi:hypothetical protein